MLYKILIKDIVLIKNLEIQFKPGLSVLTGETGTGKSILIDSLGLILGNKNRKISWIHIDDAAKFIQNAIQKNNYSGTYNLATENNITEIELIKILRKKYCSCALIINMPFIIIKLLTGERSKIINTNYTVSVDKLKKNNFQWIYEKFDDIF